MTPDNTYKLGWIGTGRMGYALCERLLASGCDLSVFNRTRSKAEPLADKGARIVDSPADLADCDIVFTMVAGPADVLEVTLGENGVLSDPNHVPRVLVDATTIDPETSLQLRRGAAEVGTGVLAAPVSGNPKVVKAGLLTVVVSGPSEVYEDALPYLEFFGRGVSYVGQKDEARLVKICHNLLLGVVAQALAEITILAEAGGVSRHDSLSFINDSVMGSVFSRYKTPALVNLDWTPTFTWHLLRKDFELGLDQGKELNVALPTAELVHSIIANGIENGHGEEDFAALLEVVAQSAGMTLESEDVAVRDGLS